MVLRVGAPLVVAALAFASCVLAEGIPNSIVSFHGPQVSANFTPQDDPSSIQQVSDLNLQEFIAHQVGVAPSSDETRAFVRQSTGVALPFTRPRSVLVFLHEHHTHDILHARSSFPFYTKCTDLNCLVDKIGSRTQSILSRSFLTINGRSAFVTLHAEDIEVPSIENLYRNAVLPALKSSGVEKAEINSPKEYELVSFSDNEFDASAATVPAALTHEVSVQVDANNITINATDSFSAVFDLNDKCVPSLFAELNITAASFEAHLEAEKTDNAPLISFVSPFLTLGCLKDSDAPNAAEQQKLAEFLFERLASKLVFETLSERNAIAVAISLPVTMEMTSPFWQSDVAVVKMDTEASFNAVGDHSTAAYERLLQETPVTTTPAPTSAKGDLTPEERVQRAERTQIVFWVCIVGTVAVAWAVYATIAMTNVRDPMLYTKVAAG